MKSNLIVSKNEEYTVTIEDLTTNGEGVGKINGYALFVKDTVPGDVARVRVTKTGKTYGFGRMMELLTPSPDRVEAVCPIARSCGGCQLQALSYEQQLEFKRRIIENNLRRIGGLDINVGPILGMENQYHYRNKAQFPVGQDKNGNIVMGFYAGRTHSIIETEKCYIGSGVNEGILAAVKDYMLKNNVKPYNEETHTGLVRHVLIRTGFTTGEVMVCLVINGNAIPHPDKLVENLQKVKLVHDGELANEPVMTSIMLNFNTDKTNVIMGKECKCLYGRSYIEDYIGNVKYQISPLSFYQVNSRQTEVLYGKALEYAGLTGNETVWDLYCGIGTISLFLAQKAKQVFGVEIVPQAIDDAKNNARINNIDNAEFYVGKAEEVLPEKFEKEHIHAEVIVVDPPRKGCDEKCLETMIKMQPERIVYVSCDSATLARDLKYLTENGYEVKKVQGVDQFGQTVHVETIVALHRTNS